MTLMTKGQFAAHRGVGKSAVSNWAKKGLLVMGECPSTNAVMVDVERTEARINSRVDPMRGRPAASLPAPLASLPVDPGDAAEATLAGRSVAKVRAELAEENLVTLRLKNAERGKELAPRIELERRAAELGRVARERMQAMFRAIAERLAAERDARTIMAIGSAEIDRVFAELANDVEAGKLAEPDEPDDAAVENELEAAAAEV
jgi:hypothetical protein